MLDPRFANQPLAIEPGAAVRRLSPGAADALYGPAPESASDRRGYDVVAGVALIGIYGVLLPRLGTLRPWGDFATGYDGIRANVLTALADAEVRALVLDVDSPGGMVDGCFDLADTIHAARGSKPIVAIVADHAYSAAYALASAADFITVPRTGGVGSIGVITGLMDVSGALEKAGLGMHFVTYGARKAEEMRASYTGVSKPVLERMQRDVDRIGELFVATAARNRAVSADAVRAQEAACFMGQAAVEAGLADNVMAPADAFAALLADLGAA